MFRPSGGAPWGCHCWRGSRGCPLRRRRNRCCLRRRRGPAACPGSHAGPSGCSSPRPPRRPTHDLSERRRRSSQSFQDDRDNAPNNASGTVTATSTPSTCARPEALYYELIWPCTAALLYGRPCPRRNSTDCRGANLAKVPRPRRPRVAGLQHAELCPKASHRLHHSYQASRRPH